MPDFCLLRLMTGKRDLELKKEGVLLSPQMARVTLTPNCEAVLQWTVKQLLFSSPEGYWEEGRCYPSASLLSWHLTCVETEGTCWSVKVPAALRRKKE